MEEKQMNSIVIFSAKVAKDLIRHDFKVVDIKPHEQEKIRTVFYFEYTEKLRQYLKLMYDINVPEK